MFLWINIRLTIFCFFIWIICSYAEINTPAFMRKSIVNSLYRVKSYIHYENDDDTEGEEIFLNRHGEQDVIYWRILLWQHRCSSILQLLAYVQGSLSPLFYRRFLSPLFIAAFFSGSDSVMRSGSNSSLIVGTELVFFLNYWQNIDILDFEIILKKKWTLGTALIPRVFDNPHSGKIIS